jgi:hypothetical protein
MWEWYCSLDHIQQRVITWGIGMAIVRFVWDLDPPGGKPWGSA